MTTSKCTNEVLSNLVKVGYFPGTSFSLLKVIVGRVSTSRICLKLLNRLECKSKASHGFGANRSTLNVILFTENLLSLEDDGVD